MGKFLLSLGLSWICVRRFKTGPSSRYVSVTGLEYPIAYDNLSITRYTNKTAAHNSLGITAMRLSYPMPLNSASGSVFFDNLFNNLASTNFEFRL